MQQYKSVLHHSFIVFGLVKRQDASISKSSFSLKNKKHLKIVIDIKTSHSHSHNVFPVCRIQL